MIRRPLLAAIFFLCLAGGSSAGDGNRLAYLDQPPDPFWVGLRTPRLTTPQWIGQEGVEAVVVLSIDDLHDIQKYEDFLRPLLDRLKRIDGRAPVSIITTEIDPQDSRLQTWLREGVSLEAHTIDHPCPCLQKGGLPAAKDTYDRCVDLLCQVPNMRPVLFRMPCFDSQNTTGPRFFAEIFNRTTPAGNFLMLGSTVAGVATEADPALPRELTRDEGDRPRFAKYVPVDRGYVAYVENYPYPYVIGRLCWEVPAIVPDDWQGQHQNGRTAEATLVDMRAAIDAAVIKQGAVTLVFHPHGWIRNTQLVDLIDRVEQRHGGRVKYLNFAEVYERITANALGGQPLRASGGGDNGVRVLDLNADGLMDAVIGNEQLRQTRLWSPEQKRWMTGDFPVPIVQVDAADNRRETGVLFGVLQESGYASILVRDEQTAGLWHFDGEKWIADPQGLDGLDLDGPVLTARGGLDQGTRLRDIDGDGRCELLVSNPSQNAVFGWSEADRRWRRLPFGLPAGTAFVDSQGRDAGLRLTDIDGDGRLDVVFSNAERYAVCLFTPGKGWDHVVLSGLQSENRPDALPPIVRADGTNNGAWIKDGCLRVQNEETSLSREDHIITRRLNYFVPASAK